MTELLTKEAEDLAAEVARLRAEHHEMKVHMDCWRERARNAEERIEEYRREASSTPAAIEEQVRGGTSAVLRFARDAVGETIAERNALREEIKRIDGALKTSVAMIDMLTRHRDGAVAEVAALKLKVTSEREISGMFSLASQEVTALKVDRDMLTGRLIDVACALGAEREACAKVAATSNFVDGPKGTVEGQIAAAIRARGLEATEPVPTVEESIGMAAELAKAYRAGIEEERKVIAQFVSRASVTHPSPIDGLGGVDLRDMNESARTAIHGACQLLAIDIVNRGGK